MEEKVLEQFAGLAGLSEEDAAEWSGMAKVCLSQLRGLLKQNFDEEAQGDLLCTAAASLLFYRYALVKKARAEESFSAGDLSVKTGDGTAAARTLWEESRGALAPWLESPGFVFERMRG